MKKVFRARMNGYGPDPDDERIWNGEEERKVMSSNKNKTSLNVSNTVLTALFMGLIVAMTLIIRIPVPATHGYIHLGDSMIFLAVLALGKKNGALAAGIGSALADVIGGYAIYAPITLVVKALMAYIVGVFIERAVKNGRFAGSGGKAITIIGMALGGVLMVAGYYIAEVFMYGNWLVPLSGVGMNCIQFAVGGAIAFALSQALEKTPAGKNFAYSLGKK